MLKPWSIRLDLQAQPIVWLDVERRKADPVPALSTVKRGEALVTYVHDDRLRPAALSSGGGELAEYRSWPDLVADIVEAAKDGALIAGYSLAELKLLQEARPDLADMLEQRYLNANAGPWFRKHRPKVYAELEASLPPKAFMKRVGLTHFLSVPEVGYHVPNRLEDFSPAETLKRVRDGLAKSGGSYGNLTQDLRMAWKNLIKYNQHDVKGMEHLTGYIHGLSR
jgi:hypothetical protein